MASKFDSVDSVLSYLKEPEVVSSSTTSTSRIINNEIKSTRKIKKEKKLANGMISAANLYSSRKETVQILSTGRVR